MSKLGAILCSIGIVAVAGCHATNSKPNEPSSVNPNLRMVAEGVNQPLTFKATHSGELYAYDLDSGEYVYRGHLATGEQFVLRPDADQATIDKQPVDLLRQTNTRDTYRVYFSEQ